MPLIHYSGQCGHSISKFYRQAKDAPAYFCCPADHCYHDLKKQLKAPSSSSKVIVDNGVQARASEVNMDIIESNQEQANKDRREE